LIKKYVFWEIVGIFSYLLIGFWFTQLLAANACQKTFVTNCIGDFGLLLGILGFYWMGVNSKEWIPFLGSKSASGLHIIDSN
jgi:NADH:ubiquinone oxidoreductase subunit 5 (subunit L)/multisubunit Na+/H+ antiporter MnhA subunit